MTAERREEERVTPLELFFDLTLVLVFIQCTTLMSNGHSWLAVGQGLLILGLLWWAWVSYSWLTSAVDPEKGLIRLIIFAAIGALLVVAVSAPEAFNTEGLTFALSYAIVRVAHLVLFFIASRDDKEFRSAIWGFSTSAAISIVLVLAGTFFDGYVRFGLWALALLIDAAGPYVSGSKGWRIIAGHFAERHGHIIIIAMGESIIAVGFGVGTNLTGTVLLGVVLSFVITASLWWFYFDVLSAMAEEKLRGAKKGIVQNTVARDAYSYFHFPMIAGIVLIAFGTKSVLSHIDEPMGLVPALALSGGLGIYLLGNYAFKVRLVGSLFRSRLIAGVVMIAVGFAIADLNALVALACVATLVFAFAIYDTFAHAHTRNTIKEELDAGVS